MPVRKLTQKAFKMYMASLRGEYRRLRSKKADDFSMLDMYINIAKAVHVSTKTIDKWGRGESFAHGLALVRLRCFLEHQGYSILEWGNVTVPVRDLIEQIYLDMIDWKFASQQLGYESPTRLLRVLLGNEQPTNSFRVKELVSQVEVTAHVIERRYHDDDFCPPTD